MLKMRTCLPIIAMMFLAFAIYANTVSSLDKDLQGILDDFRKDSKAPAAAMSIGYSDGSTQRFLSGNVDHPTNDNQNPAKVTPKTLFQIGSITKTFIAAIILQLEAEGKLSVNDTIEATTKTYGSWLSEAEFNAWKNITIKQLLNMTSGIYNITENAKFNQTYLVDRPDKQWLPDEELDIVMQNKPYFVPGAGWHYSDSNYIILGLLLQIATSSTVEELINTRMINAKSLQLKNTFYLPYPYPENVLSAIAHGYAYGGGDFSPPVIAGTDVTNINMSVANAAGAMVSNPDDMIRWVRALFMGQIIPSNQLAEMMTVVCTGRDLGCRPGEELSSNSKQEGFGLGLAYANHPNLGPIWFYVGSTAGYYSAFMWLPNDQIALSMAVSSSGGASKRILKVLIDAAKHLPRGQNS